MSDSVPRDAEMPTPTFFATPADLRRWLQKHHRTTTELWVGFYKKGTGEPSITWPESVDEALCFGWIDGLRKTIDASRYMIRFTPRRPDSVWSAVNIRRARELMAQGRMRPPGRAAFERLDERKTRVYSYDRQQPPELDAALAARFRANAAAWAFFEAQPPGYRRTATWYVMSARQEPTRLRRLDALVALSAAGQRLDPMATRNRAPGGATASRRGR